MNAFIKLPLQHPFADWEWIPSAIECWTKGVDVYLDNTCSHFFINATFNYSPLWLRITFLRFADDWTNIFGLAFAALFFLSLALLPPPRTRLDFSISLLATISSATALAVERANTDLIMFLMIIASVWACGLWLPFRLAGYGLITLAGLLKFYPFVALIIAIRERPAVFAAVALTAATALCALVFSYHDEMLRMARNLPAASYFTLQFSVNNLPGGLGIAASNVAAKLLRPDATSIKAIGSLVYKISLLLLIAQALATAVWFGHRCRLHYAVGQLTTREADFLLVGAALICGCFFAGQSVIYKGIFLLLPVPGLLALSHHSPWKLARLAFRSTCVAIVFVLWFPFIEACVRIVDLGKRPAYLSNEAPDNPVGYVLWLCDELAWWWIIIVLIAVLGALVLNSELWAALSRALPLPARWRIDGAAPADFASRATDALGS
jgi:hypothetical protein